MNEMSAATRVAEQATPLANGGRAGAPQDMPPQAIVAGVQVNADPTTGPFFVDGCNTLGKLFRARCRELGNRTAHREKDLGIWRAFSWKDYWEKSQLIGLGLIALGARRGEAISILSEDNKEWLYTDIGA